VGGGRTITKAGGRGMRLGVCGGITFSI